MYITAAAIDMWFILQPKVKKLHVWIIIKSTNPIKNNKTVVVNDVTLYRTLLTSAKILESHSTVYQPGKLKPQKEAKKHLFKNSP